MNKLLRFTLLATISTFISYPSQARLMNEIIEGCTAQAGVSASCIILSPFYALITTFGVPTESIAGDSKESKIVYRARPDATMFIATDGQVKGVYLEAALNTLRQQHLYQVADDLTLAKMILTYTPNVK